MTIAGLERDLPLCRVNDQLYIGAFVIFGDVELTVMDYIVRDHDMEKFLAKKEQMQKAAEYLNQKYGAGTIEVIIKDSYFNMKELILPHMYLIDLAKEAMEELYRDFDRETGGKFRTSVKEALGRERFLIDLKEGRLKALKEKKNRKFRDELLPVERRLLLLKLYCPFMWGFLRKARLFFMNRS